MHFQLPFPQPGKQTIKIEQGNKVMLLGSCFTEDIAKRLREAKFQVCSNPHGILYSPLSIANSLNVCIERELYPAKDLFLHHEIWHHWDFHSAFSDISKEAATEKMNTSVALATSFLKEADWLILTTGTAFQYYFLNESGGIPVSNCHKLPAASFKKQMLSALEITAALQATIAQLRQANPKLKIIFTVSPVRHIRDGLVENNRSKARLIEATHQLVAAHAACFYFPAYEILMDVLRDYRFYENDFVHPNSLAIETIWEQFSQTYFSEETRYITAKIQSIQQACLHRPMFPETKAHQNFIQKTLEKINAMKQQFPYLDFEEEIKLLECKRG